MNLICCVYDLYFVFTCCLDITNVSTSSVAASPMTGVVADGLTYAIVTVTLKDTYNNPVIGATVILSSDSATSSIGAASGNSSATGVVKFNVTDTTADVATYTATEGNLTIAETVQVTFVHGKY